MAARVGDRRGQIDSDRVDGAGRLLTRVSVVLLVGAFLVVAAPVVLVGWAIFGAPADYSGGCGEMCGLIRLTIAAAVALPLLVVGGVFVAVGTFLSIRKQNRQGCR